MAQVSRTTTSHLISPPSRQSQLHTIMYIPHPLSHFNQIQHQHTIPTHPILFNNNNSPEHSLKIVLLTLYHPPRDLIRSIHNTTRPLILQNFFCHHVIPFNTHQSFSHTQHTYFQPQPLSSPILSEMYQNSPSNPLLAFSHLHYYTRNRCIITINIIIFLS